ncbi:MAG TPA: MotA/TolQ/ExbB proton channel family protein [Polyangiaceae bacterium]|nr:MotA/TolQ/ExbB proton channel family protein [Polyangiaceae bacterium]
MSFNLGHVIASMSPLSLLIAGVLLVMAILSVGVAVERWIAFYRSGRESKRFVAMAAPLIDEWKLEELAKAGDQFKNSALATLFAAVVRRYLRASEETEGRLSPVELSRNESERQKEKLAAELRRGLNVLATVGSIAPFVGLLGTVVGIIGAFQGIGATGSGGISAVSTGIAEALVETAFGLMVAIPAVILFNYLSARIAGIELALGRSVGELLDEVENHHGRDTSKQRKRQAA